MIKVKEALGGWLEPAIIIGVILYVMDSMNTRIDSVNIRIDSVNTRIDSNMKILTKEFQHIHKILDNHEAKIKTTDQKIDNLKNRLISRK